MSHRGLALLSGLPSPVRFPVTSSSSLVKHRFQALYNSAMPPFPPTSESWNTITRGVQQRSL